MMSWVYLYYSVRVRGVDFGPNPYMYYKDKVVIIKPFQNANLEDFPPYK